VIRRLALALCLALGVSPAWGAAAVWDNSNGYFTLSGGNLIATRDTAPTSTYRTLRSTTSHRGGRLYFELVVGGYADNEWMGGIVNSNASLATYLGGDALGNQDSFGAASNIAGGYNSYFSFNSTPTTNQWVTPANTDVIGFAVDANNGLIWVNKNNGAWNIAAGGTQDPATGQGGFLVSGLTTSPFYIAFCGADITTPQVATLHASAASLAASPPSGFTVWDDAVDPPAPIVDGVDAYKSGFGSGSGGSVSTSGLTTDNAGDRIIVFTYAHDVSVDPAVTAVSASSGVPGGFTLRKRQGVLGAESTEWWGFAPAPLSNSTITATLGSATGDASVVAVALRGAFNPALPYFDAEGTLPIAAGPTTGTGCHLNITTINPNDLLFYTCGTKGPLANIITPLGWETLVNTQYTNAMLLVAMRLTGAAQTALDVNPAMADNHEDTSIGDAVNGAVSGIGGIIPFSPLTGFR